MAPKGGKKGKNQQTAPKKGETKMEEDPQEQKKDMQEILNAINSLDLDNPNLIDISAFDVSKKILENSLDELQAYIKFFENGQYDKFPKPATTV